MTSFVELQNRFVAAEFAALGLEPGWQVLQPASLLPLEDDEALCPFSTQFRPTR